MPSGTAVTLPRMLAITGYQWLLFGHILAAVLWVGGASTIQLLAFRILRSDDPARIAGFAQDVEWVATRLFMPASFVLLGFGIAAVENAGWDWGSAWISIGLLVWVLSALTGMAFLGPESGRIGRLVAAQGPESPEAQRRIRRILLVSRVELALLLLAVAVMALKP